MGNIIARVRQFMNNILLKVLLNTIFSPSFVIVMAVYSCYANIAAAIRDMAPIRSGWRR
ncbi:MAG: hypothetical protein NT140_12010 [Deltaproteobacteria bacterium]|nr:hypothetical protein [Deltaproteobacteria bacterium]